MEQFYWLCHTDLSQRIQQDQHKRQDCQKQGISHRRRFNDKCQRSLIGQHFRRTEFRQLGQENAHAQTADNGNGKQHEILPQEHAGDIALSHTQNVIQSELRFPATHEERIHVEQKDDDKKCHHRYTP